MVLSELVPHLSQIVDDLTLGPFDDDRIGRPRDRTSVDPYR